MGNGTQRKKLAFCYEVDEFLLGKPCLKPKFVVNYSQIVTADGTEESEGESKGNVENVVFKLAFQQQRQQQQSKQMLGTLKQFSCGMYSWDFKNENIAY